MKDNTWENNEYFDTIWEIRVKRMSLFISVNDKKVCDIGCGEEKLMKYIPNNIKYIGVDYTKRNKSTYVHNLNGNKKLPKKIIDDVVFCSGILEYIQDIKKFVNHILKFCNKVIISYVSTEIAPDLSIRKQRNWCNHLSEKDLVELFLKKGFNLDSETKLLNNKIFCFKKGYSEIHNLYPKILIIDPILRGSRAFYSNNAMNITKFQHIDLITRTNSIDETNINYFLNLKSPFNIYERVEVPKNFWYGKISENNIKNIIKCIKELKNYNDYDLIYFTGLQELYPEILNLLLDEDSLYKQNMLFVEYNYDYLISFVANRKHNKDKQNTIDNFLQKFKNSKMAILDERVFEKHLSVLDNLYSKNQFVFLPDPAEKVPGINPKGIFMNKKTTFLLVGTQSQRKGIDVVVSMFIKYEKYLNNINFILVGKLDSYSEKYREILKKFKFLNWIDSYITDFELAKIYNSSDFIILPYTKDFNASSGVFANACLYKKPILSSSHGCIGYRINSFLLGATFNIDSNIDFFNKIQYLSSLSYSEYKEIALNCEKYANMNSIEKHQSIILKGLKNEL